MVAGQIAEAKVPVLLDPLNNLPESFESLGATLENAARLHKAGVTIAFMSGDAHNAPQHQAGRRQRRRLRPALGRRPAPP